MHRYLHTALRLSVCDPLLVIRDGAYQIPTIKSPFGPCVDLLGRYSALVDEELGPESFVE